MCDFVRRKRRQLLLLSAHAFTQLTVRLMLAKFLHRDQLLTKLIVSCSFRFSLACSKYFHRVICQSGVVCSSSFMQTDGVKMAFNLARYFGYEGTSQHGALGMPLIMRSQEWSVLII